MADDAMVAWLTGALDEIERAAQTAAETQPGGGVWEYTEAITAMPDRVEAPDGTGRVGMVAEIVSDRPGEHIALHDPRAVLARVEAERAIIAEHPARGVQGGPPYRWTCSTCDHAPVDWEAFSDYPCRTLRLLAYGHRFDAPGYRPEWSPE